MVQGIMTDNYVRVRIKGSVAAFEAVDLTGKVLDKFEVKPKTGVF